MPYAELKTWPPAVMVQKYTTHGKDSTGGLMRVNTFMGIISGLKNIYISMINLSISAAWICTCLSLQSRGFPRPFMEEFIIDYPALKLTTRVKHFMPVKNK